eukprot:3075363-Prymnesium_polylepis.1
MKRGSHVVGLAEGRGASTDRVRPRYPDTLIIRWCYSFMLRRGASFMRRRGMASCASPRDYAAEAAAQQGGELWVFGYGSLMWHTPPGVGAVTRVSATLTGYERQFCIYSRNYRGTASSPGLALGLQPSAGGVCEGVGVFLGDVCYDSAVRSLELIDEQEMLARHHVTSIYNRRVEPILLRLDAASDESQLATRSVLALTFVANADLSAPPELPLAARAEIIARASGSRGTNREYLEQSAGQLARLGLRDRH